MNDPLVNEIRQFRQEHAQHFHGNLAAICKDLRDIQQTCGHAVVTFPPKRLAPPKQTPLKNEELPEVAA
jgi:hypothetical protein